MFCGEEVKKGFLLPAYYEGLLIFSQMPGQFQVFSKL